MARGVTSGRGFMISNTKRRFGGASATRTRVLIIAVILCGSLPCLAALADTKEDEARNSFQLGVELYKDGKYQEAAIAFSRAYELKPSYKILFNMAQAEAELSHYAKALDAYTRYLAGGGDEVTKERRDQVRAEIKRLNSLVGSITVTSAVEGATVFLDDARQGDTPLAGPLFVDIGEHVVVLKKSGNDIHKEKVTIAGGSKVEIKVEAGGPQSVAGPAAEPRPAAEPTPKAEEKPAEAQRLWTWVALGVGGAAVVGAAITGGLAVSQTSDIKDDCDGNVCPDSRQGDIDSAKTLGTTTDVLIAVGAVGVAAGVVLFFLEPGFREEDGAAVSFAPTVRPDGAGFSLQGRF
jgi:hypothetical protein